MSILGQNRTDFLGIGVSTLCALHCLLPPLLLAVAPVLALNEEALEAFHPVFILLAAPIAYLALSRGYKMHANDMPGLLAISGIVMLTTAIFVEEPHWLEKVITVAGSALIIWAHTQNNRLCKACPACSPN